MANTLLGFGIFALAAAVVGGGLKAFGFELPAFASIPRQLLLGAIGLIVIISVEWDSITSLMIPRTTETNGPIQLRSGGNHNFTLYLPRRGRVDVTVQSIVPDRDVFIRLCSGRSASCDGVQVGESGSLSKILDEGPATLSVFNFGTSPPVIFSSTTSYPKY
jgi:hypothetical protein